MGRGGELCCARTRNRGPCTGPPKGLPRLFIPRITRRYPKPALDQARPCGEEPPPHTAPHPQETPSCPFSATPICPPHLRWSINRKRGAMGMVPRPHPGCSPMPQPRPLGLFPLFPRDSKPGGRGPDQEWRPSPTAALTDLKEIIQPLCFDSKQRNFLKTFQLKLA